MSDKLTLSAALSVLLMTAYVLFGNETAHAPFGSAGLDGSESVAARSLPALHHVLADAGSRRILY